MRIHHIALRTADLERLETFYVQGLGLARSNLGGTLGRSTWLELGGAVLMLERADPSEPPVPRGTRELLAFGVDDLDAWRARLGQAGIAVELATAHTLYFRDPDGRRIAVSNYPLD